MTRPDRKAAAADVTVQDSELDTPLDDDEPTSEELVNMLRESIKQANAGQTRPIEELLRELDEILAEDDVEG